jgi:hypothetical protein
MSTFLKLLKDKFCESLAIQKGFRLRGSIRNFLIETEGEVVGAYFENCLPADLKFLIKPEYQLCKYCLLW